MSNGEQEAGHTDTRSMLEQVTAAATAKDSPQARTLIQRRERRREETDRKILQATLQIVATQGIGAVTIEEVARRSGVAKTTIYRRYRNTDDMLRRLSTMQWPANIINPINLEPSRCNLQHMLEAATTRFDEEIGLKAVGVVLSASNGYFEQIVEQVIQPVKQHFIEFFTRGQQAGVFRHGLDLSFIFATIIGSMMANQALTDETSASWATKMTDLLWPMIAA
ncbi:TetR/AcrR family transcriptional regulator [Bifidobacterium thermophilum]|uniref:TetR/AcrR family transcriptional regulator n=1 Tax=Bifidobacterium thermophilum TaxID=33905 RepID=UPI0030B00298